MQGSSGDSILIHRKRHLRYVYFFMILLLAILFLSPLFIMLNASMKTNANLNDMISIITILVFSLFVFCLLLYAGYKSWSQWHHEHVVMMMNNEGISLDFLWTNKKIFIPWREIGRVYAYSALWYNHFCIRLLDSQYLFKTYSGTFSLPFMRVFLKTKELSVPDISLEMSSDHMIELLLEKRYPKVAEHHVEIG